MTITTGSCVARAHDLHESRPSEKQMETSSDPFGLVGSTIGGRYVVEALVGEGGFSVVYRARHVLWNRPVAIKAFRGLEALDAEAQGRLLRAFIREGAILAELSERSTAIVQARDTATLVTPNGDWVPYLVLEWLPGETLETILWRERQAGLSPRRLDEAASLLEPIAQALALAHEQGICHRDLKPGNLVVLGDARVPGSVIKLLDFGTAGLFSEAHRALGGRARARECSAFTPAYAAPEQFSQAYGVTGPWTDVFALALVVVELLSGREPMGEGRPLAEFAAVASDPARRPTPRALGVDVSDAVERVFARALAVFPAERWPTVGTFWRALRQALRELPVDLSPASAHRAGAARAAPVVALGIVLALAASASSDHRVGRAPQATSATDAVARVHPVER